MIKVENISKSTDKQLKNQLENISVLCTKIKEQNTQIGYFLPTKTNLLLLKLVKIEHLILRELRDRLYLKNVCLKDLMSNLN